MQVSPNGINMIKSDEGLRLTAYQDQAEVWTIGYGSVSYQNGAAVKKGDVITMQQAEDLLLWEVNMKTGSVASMVSGVALNQNQYDSLIDFAYNAGTGALQVSTLLKRIKANPQDPTITDAFMMWDKIHVDGQLVYNAGLAARRQREAQLYFTPMS